MKVCAYLQHPDIRNFFFNLRESQDGYIVKDCKALNFSKALPYLYSSNISQQRIFVSWAKVLYMYILIYFSRIHFEKANSISNTYLGILQSKVESYKMGFWTKETWHMTNIRIWRKARKAKSRNTTIKSHWIGRSLKIQFMWIRL